MIKLGKETVKKAGLASLLVGSMFVLGTVISPQVESYKALRDELSSLSVGDRQKTVYKEIAKYKSSSTIEKFKMFSERVLMLDDYPIVRGFSKR